VNIVHLASLGLLVLDRHRMAMASVSDSAASAGPRRIALGVRQDEDRGDAFDRLEGERPLLLEFLPRRSRRAKRSP